MQSARSSVTYELASYPGSGINDDVISTASSSCSSDNSGNEFRKLKAERKKERRKRKLARSVSGHIGIFNQSKSPSDTETLLLAELADTSRRGMSERDEQF